MTERQKLSRLVRFEIFKRDNFTCQYCGQTPPAVVLEVDHIVPKADDGSDEPHNLITACFDCNHGKGAVPLSDRPTPEDLKVKRALMQDRIEQAEAYELLLKERRAIEETRIDEVIGLYEESFDGWTLLDSTRPSIRQFLRKLPQTIVMEAMERACARTNKDRAWRYFCGICWRKILHD